MGERIERRERRRGERRGDEDDIYRPLWPLRRLPAEKILIEKEKKIFFFGRSRTKPGQG